MAFGEVVWGAEVVGAGAEDAERCVHWGKITGSVKLGNKKR